MKLQGIPTTAQMLTVMMPQPKLPRGRRKRPEKLSLQPLEIKLMLPNVTPLRPLKPNKTLKLDKRLDS